MKINVGRLIISIALLVLGGLCLYVVFDKGFNILTLVIGLASAAIGAVRAKSAFQTESTPTKSKKSNTKKATTKKW